MPETDPRAESGVPLLEGWMFGVAMYPMAVAVIVRQPAANDP
jgi:hypothetical protein